MYKVFYNSRCIQLEGFFNIPDQFTNQKVVRYQDDAQLKKEVLGFLEQQSDADLSIVTEGNETHLMKSFLSVFTLREAAGGLVRNGYGEWLFIFRNGFWDLPKGHLKKYETPENGALREVEEETQLGGLKITGSLPVTHHVYYLKGRWMIKRTFWFQMSCKGRPNPFPQFSEGIELAEWKSQDEALSILNLSYRSIREGLGESFTSAV
ncbi:MAG: NUDIX domain-containing protein [Bacteroidales bacterium]|nr:NUDIX domain-containing protein [Bacteroidales bacterium]